MATPVYDRPKAEPRRSTGNIPRWRIHVPSDTPDVQALPLYPGLDASGFPHSIPAPDDEPQ